MTEYENAASWQLAVQLVRLQAEARVFETHPGGGQYDCLTVVSPHLLIDINRAGSIHARALASDAVKEGRHAILHMGWHIAVFEEGSDTVARRILQDIRVEPSAESRPVPPHLLTYEVISGALTAGLQAPPQRAPSRPGLEALQQYSDTSGMGGGGRWPAPSEEMRGLPSNRVWVLVRDGRPQTWLWDGWAWTAGGERLDLVARHAAGAPVEDLVELVTAPIGGQTAPALPPVNTPDPQPIGPWPRF